MTEITLQETGWKCSQELYDDVLNFHGVDLHKIKRNIQKNLGTKTIAENIVLEYTISTMNGYIEITSRLVK